METKVVNHGFVKPSQEDIDKSVAKGYVLGAKGGLGAVTPIINPSGDWRPYLPVFEWQGSEYLETCNCTAFGTLNAVEILEKYKYGTTPNYSDRALGIAAGTRPPGNDPHKVADTIRKVGLCDESVLPFVREAIKTIEAYYAPDPLTQDILNQCKAFLAKYDFGHEWSFQGGSLASKQAKLLEGLKRSPIGISVAAWYAKDGVYYHPDDADDNHWCTLIYGDPGKRWYILDSYDQFVKELQWDYDFGYAKVYYLPTAKEKLDILSKILDLLAKILKIDLLIINQNNKQAESLPAPITPPAPQPTPQPKPEMTQEKPPETMPDMVRRVCREENLSLDLSDQLYRTIQCESGFNPTATNKNENGTVDYGICQYNSKWYIGPGKPIPSKEVALGDPEFCVRVMCRAFKQGRAKDWICWRKIFGSKKVGGQFFKNMGEENKSNIPSWLQSSTGEGIAARWKALASAVVPTLVLVGPLVGIHVTPGEVDPVVNGVEVLISAVWAALSAGWFVYGAVRALLYKKEGLGKYAK